MKTRTIKTIVMSMVMVLGLSTTAMARPNDFGGDTSRVYGLDRFETANKIADEFAKPNSQLPVSGDDWDFVDTASSKVDTVILANGFNFPDAVCSTPLSKIYNAPVLLTHDYALTPSTANQIKKMGITKVVIVGGEGVVTPKVEQDLKAIGVKSIERFGGIDRYATSLAIAKRVDESCDVDALGIVGRDNWVNALTLAPSASRYNYPILLAPDETNPILPQYKEFIAKLEADVASRNTNGAVLTKLVCGTKDEITPATLEGMQENLSVRQDQYNFCNSSMVDNMFTLFKASTYGLVPASKNVFCTRADVYADSLSVAPLASKLNAPVVMYGTSSDKYKTIEDEINNVGRQFRVNGEIFEYKGYVNKLQEAFNISNCQNLTLIGGEAVLSNRAEGKIRNAW